MSVRLLYPAIATIAAALAVASCGSATLRPDGGDGGGAGGRGGAGGTGGSAGNGSSGTGGSVGGTGGAAGTGGTAGSTAGTGGAGATAGTAGSTAGTGGGTAGRGGTGGTAGTGGSTGGTGGSTAGTGGGGAAGRGGTGGTGGGTGGTAGSGGTPDTTRPQILDVSPFNGQTGIASNAKVVITFSEAMNQNAVRNAYSSTTLLPAQVTFSWNAAGTMLTITPNNPLPYATGTSLTIPANAFSFQISTAATDLAGNGLAAGFSSSFTTLRRITTSAAATSVFGLLNTTPSGPSQVRPIPCNDAMDQGNTIGYFSSIAFASARILYVEFLIAAAPAGVSTVESATFRGVQTKSDGDPYAMNGPILADQIPFQTSPNADSNSVAPIRRLGTFATSISTAMPEMSVTPMLQQAFDANGEQVMIRLTFEPLATMHAVTYFACGGFLATWTYLVP